MKKVVDEGSKEGADEAQVVKEKKYGEILLDFFLCLWES